jgi:single-strand DNA-binding protein
MSSYTHVVILGNMTRDPEMRYMPNGMAVVDLSIATNNKWTDKASGEKKEEANFFDVTAFGKLAEISAEYLKKGRKVMISGRLKQERWETPEGQKRQKVKVIADQVLFIGSYEKNDEAAPAADAVPAAGGAEDLAI